MSDENRWVQLVKRDDWGFYYYAEHGADLNEHGTADSKLGLKLEEGAVVKVRFSNGVIVDAPLASRVHREDASEQGQPWGSSIVTATFWGVVTEVQGISIWVDLIDLKVHADSLPEKLHE